MFRNWCFIIVLTIGISTIGSAQQSASYNRISNDVHVIHSKILNEDRQCFIHVPTLDSTDTSKTMPILYLLDGENHFHILSAYVEYLSHWKAIPPMIVVGIVSVDRAKDLTPTNSLRDFDGQVDSGYKKSGGNEQFLNFIQQELMTYIDAKYKTSGQKLFAGHSFGGLAVINCLLTRPEMFDAYIAISPSLWWDNKYMLNVAAKRMKSIFAVNKKLFYSNANEDGSFADDLKRFDAVIKRGGRLKHKYVQYPAEDHMTEPIPAYYDALRFMFK